MQEFCNSGSPNLSTVLYKRIGLQYVLNFYRFCHWHILCLQLPVWIKFQPMQFKPGYFTALGTAILKLKIILLQLSSLKKYTFSAWTVYVIYCFYNFDTVSVLATGYFDAVANKYHVRLADFFTLLLFASVRNTFWDTPVFRHTCLPSTRSL